MKGKNFNISSYINDYEQGFTIISDREKSYPCFRVFKLSREPKIDSEVFNTCYFKCKGKY